jgi:hypothetical protein
MATTSRDLDAEARRLLPNMRNRAMARKLLAGEALDVRREGAPAQCPLDLARGATAPAGDTVFALRRFVDDVDYCDALLENWIWSIGREETTGRIFASTDARYYQADGFECLFLR